jgi:hypothetical protein
MQNILIGILLFFYGFNIQSAPPKNDKAFQITRCLGAEEALIHKAKDHGPVYQVNQILLSIFLNLSQINLKKKYYQELCAQPEVGTSLRFLELIFRNYNQLFTTTNAKDEKSAKLEDIAELINKLPELFNQYLLELKIKSPVHNCLEKNIKELSNFYIQVQYLEEDTNFKVIADKDKQLIKILDQLKQKEEIFERCKNEMNSKKE